MYIYIYVCVCVYPVVAIVHHGCGKTEHSSRDRHGLRKEGREEEDIWLHRKKKKEYEGEEKSFGSGLLASVSQVLRAQPRNLPLGSAS